MTSSTLYEMRQVSGLTCGQVWARMQEWSKREAIAVPDSYTAILKAERRGSASVEVILALAYAYRKTAHEIAWALLESRRRPSPIQPRRGRPKKVIDA